MLVEFTCQTMNAKNIKEKLSNRSASATLFYTLYFYYLTCRHSTISFFVQKIIYHVSEIHMPNCKSKIIKGSRKENTASTYRADQVIY